MRHRDPFGWRGPHDPLIDPAGEFARHAAPHWPPDPDPFDPDGVMQPDLGRVFRVDDPVDPYQQYRVDDPYQFRVDDPVDPCQQYRVDDPYQFRVDDPVDPCQQYRVDDPVGGPFVWSEADDPRPRRGEDTTTWVAGAAPRDAAHEPSHDAAACTAGRESAATSTTRGTCSEGRSLSRAAALPEAPPPLPF